VRRLHPDLKDSEVEIHVTQTRGSTIFNVLATGREPSYTRIYLDALLDECVAFQRGFQEGSNKLAPLRVQVANQQAQMEKTIAALEKLRAKVDTVSAKSDQQRLSSQLNSLRSQRDKLQVQLRSLHPKDTERSALEAKLNATEQEIEVFESQLQRYEPDLAELRKLTSKYVMEKMAYEKLFEKVELTHTSLIEEQPFLPIQERASPAVENMDWTMPILFGAMAGGVPSLALGLLLSLFLVRSAQVPQSEAHPDRLP
jgi:myosin heavy subunit